MTKRRKCNFVLIGILFGSPACFGNCPRFLTPIVNTNINGFKMLRKSAPPDVAKARRVFYNLRQWVSAVTDKIQNNMFWPVFYRSLCVLTGACWLSPMNQRGVRTRALAANNWYDTV